MTLFLDALWAVPALVSVIFLLRRLSQIAEPRDLVLLRARHRMRTCTTDMLMNYWELLIDTTYLEETR